MSQIFTGDFLEGLAKGAGIEIDDDTKKALASKDGQIPTAFTDKIQAAYFTRQTAINDFDIKRSAGGAIAGTVEQNIWKYVQSLGITIDEWNSKFREFDPDTKKYKHSIIDDINTVLPLLAERINEKAEKKNGLNTKELRDSIAKEMRSEYESKMETNRATIEDYESKLTNATNASEKMKLEWDSTLEKERIFNHVSQMVGKIPLKPAIAEMGMEDDVREKAINAITAGYTIAKDDKGDYIPFRKDDPTARAMNAKNQLYDLEGLISETMQKHIDPNGGKATGSGDHQGKLGVLNAENGEAKKAKMVEWAKY